MLLGYIRVGWGEIFIMVLGYRRGGWGGIFAELLGYQRGGLGGIFIALLDWKRGGKDKVARGVAHKRGRHPIPEEEGMKVRKGCLALMQAGGEG